MMIYMIYDCMCVYLFVYIHECSGEQLMHECMKPIEQFYMPRNITNAFINYMMSFL